MAEILRKRCNMGAYEDEAKNGTWFCEFTYTDWKGEKLTKKKRGFATKKDALTWEREFFDCSFGFRRYDLSGVF